MSWTTYLIVHLVCGIIAAGLIEYTIWKRHRTWLHARNIAGMILFFLFGTAGLFCVIVAMILVAIDKGTRPRITNEQIIPS